MKITFTPALEHAIQQEINCQPDERGVEEIIGDNLAGANRTEWDKLIALHGFAAVTKAVKKKWSLL